MPVTPETIHGSFRLFARLFPSTPLRDVTALTFEELKEKYRSRDQWGNVAGLLAFCGLAVGCFFAIDAAADWCCRDMINAKFLLRPQRFEWGLYAGFLSLFCTGYLCLSVIRRILGREEWAVYLAYGNHKMYPTAPFDAWKVFRLFFWVGVPPLVAVAVLRVDTYTAFLGDAVVDNSFWSLGRRATHPYAAIRGLYEVRGYHARFEDKVAPWQVIVFGDGQRWETNPGTGGPSLAYQRSILRYVAERSGRDVEEVDFVEQIPP